MNSHLVEVTYDHVWPDVLPLYYTEMKEGSSWLSMKSSRDIKTGLGVSQLVAQ